MKNFIIFLNFLLITLLIYNLLNHKIIEKMSNCPNDKKNAIYRQQALTNRLFSEMNTLKAEYTTLNNNMKNNKLLIDSNKRNIKKTVQDLENEKQRQSDKLDKLA